MLLPTVNSMDEIYAHQRIDLVKAKDAFQIFRNIAANSYGAIATESMGFVVAMELAGIGGGELCKRLSEETSKLFLYAYDLSQNREGF